MIIRRLTRYVVEEFLKVFLLTLASMTLFMVVVLVGREAMRQGLGLAALIRLLPYVLPEALLFAVPATTLLTACNIFGRMSFDNELLAIKSAGIPPSKMICPALVLAFLVSLVAVWLNDVAVSWGEPGIRRVIVESVEQIAYRMLRARRSYSRPRFSIHVARVDGRRLVKPTLVFFAAGNSPETILTAREALLKRCRSDNSLTMVLTDGVAERGDDVLFAFDGQQEFVIPLMDDKQRAGGAARPSHLPFRRLPGEIKAQRIRVDQRRRSLATRAALQMIIGQFPQLTSSAWQADRARLSDEQHRLKHLQSVSWRRWANGFSCLFFAMVGVPLAIQMRNANLFTTFAACFMPILLIYYPLLAYGVDRAKCGALPPYAVWLGNAVCCLVGVILLRRVQRQ